LTRGLRPEIIFLLCFTPLFSVYTEFGTDPNDRIFISFMQLMIDAKYTNAFQQTLEELHIPFETSGSFPKRLSKHDIPLR